MRPPSWRSGRVFLAASALDLHYGVFLFVFGCVSGAGREPGPDRVAGCSAMPAQGHAIPFIALEDGKFNVTDQAAEFLKSVRTLFGDFHHGSFKAHSCGVFG